MHPLMIRPDTSELLLRIYQKRTASFLAYLYKAGMTANVANIHKTRVSVKKIYAIFHLLEMIGHGSFDRKKTSDSVQGPFQVCRKDKGTAAASHPFVGSSRPGYCDNRVQEISER